MAQDSLGKSLRRTLLRLAGGAPSPDGQLLERFVSGQDESAFAELVHRHGAMVFGVCQRVLRHAQDAEDAFQAAFIVLARKASSVTQPDLLSHWLYKVALRVAFKARTSADRRRTSQQLSDESVHDQRTENRARSEQDWRLALDEELSGLPDKYRAPLVLCYLQGKTNQEAAAALRCPLRTIERRLSDGREMLRARLQRHGVALTAATLTSLLAEEIARAGIVPAALAASASRTAVLAAVGKGFSAAGISANVGALADAALKTMGTSKWKVAMAVLAVLAALALGAVGLMPRTQGPSSVQAEQRNTPTPLWRLKRSIPVANLYDVSLSPDGRTCVSTSADHTVRLWDTGTGRQKATLPVQGTFTRFSPDGRWLALTDIKTGKAHIVETASAKVMWSPPTQVHVAVFAAKAPAHVMFDSLERDAQVKVYDAATGKVLGSYRLPAEARSVCVSDRYWAALGPSDQVTLHDLVTGKELTSVTCPGVKSLPSPQSGKALMGFQTTGVTVWRMPTFKELGKYSWNERTDVSAASDGRWLLVGRQDGTVELLETETGKQLWRKKRPSGMQLFSPDGNWLASTGAKWSQKSVPAADFGIEIWERKSGKVVQSLPAPKMPLLQAATASSLLLPNRILFFPGLSNHDRRCGRCYSSVAPGRKPISFCSGRSKSAH